MREIALAAAMKSGDAAPAKPARRQSSRYRRRALAVIGFLASCAVALAVFMAMGG